MKIGFKAYCPVCDSRLMLCDECKHRTGKYVCVCVCDCDYDSITETRQNRQTHLKNAGIYMEDENEKL